MVAFLVGDALLLKQLTDIVVVQVNGRHHDMAGRLSLQLDDALAKVSLNYLDAMLLQVGVHLTLLSEHRLRLHHLLDVMALQNAIDNLVELLRILGPVHLYAVLLGCGGKLVEVFVEVGDGMTFDSRRLLAQLFPLVKAISHIVAFASY